MLTKRTAGQTSSRSQHQLLRAVISYVGQALLVGAVCLGAGFASFNVALAQQADAKIVVKVGATAITSQAFEDYLSRTQRKRFYHGVPAGEQSQQFRREVADELINRILLLQEARQRGLKPDRHAIQKTLDYYDKRYANEPRWQRNRTHMLKALRVQAEEENLLQQLEAQIRRVAPPSEKQLLVYYAANPDKFTEPTSDRVALILLAVAPSAEGAMWQAARAEADKLTSQLHQGASFSELARLHSADLSARNGGDMGYLHRGMLSPQAEAAVSQLTAGEITEPIKVLEGIAIFRLLERRPAKQLTFKAARQRVRELWLRERNENAWQSLQQKLRASTPVRIYDPSLRS